MTPRCYHMYTADAYMQMFPHGRILVRISREVGLQRASFLRQSGILKHFRRGALIISVL